LRTRATAKLPILFHPRQQLAFESPATEILFGGAAGPGKSHLLRIAAITWASQIPGLQIYLFRRIREDLIRNHIEGPKGFRSLLAPWTYTNLAKIVGDDEIRFFNGSKIHLCHCKDEADRFQYQGMECHVLLIDELTHFSEVIYPRSRVRAVGLNIPEHLKGKFPCILCGSNPGNIGHEWVKRFWIDNALDLQVRRMPEEEGGMLRQFITGRIEDNPSLVEDDPLYEQKLAGLGSPELVKAMRYGDWDVIEGAFFPEFARQSHVIKPFAIPEHWTRFVSGDWGSAVPFSFGWWAVVPDQFDGDLERIGGQRLDPAMRYRNDLPRGAIIRYKEWYGSPDHSNKGLKLTAEDVAAGSFGVPAMYFFETCVDTIRTFPFAQHDPAKPEDLLAPEDHTLDEIRYACMSRPYSVEHDHAEPTRFPAQGLGDGVIATIDDLEDLEDYRASNVARFERIR
jgi:hypothetical protein